MHITRFTDYSLRVLMYLAVKGDELSTIGDIAESYNISKNHLMKVVQELSARNYLHAIRGKNGGIKLNTEPANISVGRLVRELEGNISIFECGDSDKRCVITPACQLKEAFSLAMESFFKTLDGYSLADLVPDESKADFGQLLDIKNLNLCSA